MMFTTRSRVREIALAVALAFSLGGCATSNMQGASYVDRALSQDQAAVLASSITEFAKARLPAANSTILLEPPTDKTGNALTPALTQQLHEAGFAVASPENSVENVHRLRYLATTFDYGVLLRMYLNGVEASQWFAVDGNGHLQAGAETTVREASQ